MTQPAESALEIRLDCDVLVIGSGAAGYCAAIQAGRCGCRTILIEKDGVLGGNSGPSVGVGITGADRFWPYATETGIIHQIQEEGVWIDSLALRSNGAYTISRRFEAVVQSTLEAAGVRVLKHHYARQPVMAGRRIVAVLVEDLAGMRPVRIDVRHVVIEASGDGEMAVKAGADYAMGSESQAQYGERSAPQAASPLVQGSSLVALTCNAQRPVAFTPPPGTPPYKPRLWEGSLLHGLHHHDGMFRGDASRPRFLYMTEFGGDRDTLRDDAAIYDALLKSFWAEWDHIKNGPHAQDARNWDILWISPRTGKRESRRILGDYVLTQTDLEAGRCFEDDIAYGGHNLDDHRPLPSGHTDIHGYSIPPLYGIPYRACYSRNLDNLLLAGRLISATHLAHSSVRVIRTGAAIGQGVGLAAALCCRHGCTPRQVGAEHLAELRSRLLWEDGAVLGAALPADGDLARAARVSATSQRLFNDSSPGEGVPLLAPAGNLLYDWRSTLSAVEVYIENVSDAPQPLNLSVLRSLRQRRWRPTDNWFRQERTSLPAAGFAPLASADSTVGPRFCGWHRIELPRPVELAAKDPTSDDDLLMLMMEPNANLLWSPDLARCPLMEMWERVEHDERYKALGAVGAMRLFPPPPLGDAASIINGFARRFATAPTNMWMTGDSGEGAQMPQAVELAWDRPIGIARVRIAFDNLARTMHENPWEHGPAAMGCLVRDYAVDVRQGGQWREVIREEGNCHRLREHRLGPIEADALRLRVLAMHDPKYGARVYEISVMGE